VRNLLTGVYHPRNLGASERRHTMRCLFTSLLFSTWTTTSLWSYLSMLPTEANG
jgi:hypothetical protein